MQRRFCLSFVFLVGNDFLDGHQFVDQVELGLLFGRVRVHLLDLVVFGHHLDGRFSFFDVRRNGVFFGRHKFFCDGIFQWNWSSAPPGPVDHDPDPLTRSNENSSLFSDFNRPSSNLASV